MLPMLIEEISLYTGKIPRKYPFRTSKAVQHSVESVFIEVKNNGIIGTGEAAPREHINGETLQGTRSQLEELSELLLGEDFERAIESLHSHSLGPSTKSGMEMALLDAFSQKKGMPLWKFLQSSKRIKDKISYCAFINSDVKNGKLAKRAIKLKKQGYGIIRLKVGELEFDEDHQRIKLLRQVVGESINIWLDVNQAWDKCNALEYLNKLQPLSIFMVEQPLDQDDFLGHKYLKENSNTPIMLDESIQCESDLDLALELKCADAVNLKFMKLGSFQETKKLVKKASEEGLKVYCGGTAVTDVFASYARHVEFALPELDYFSTGIPRSNSFIENPTHPRMKFLPKTPYATRPTGRGLGVRLKHDIFAKYIQK